MQMIFKAKRKYWQEIGDIDTKGHEEQGEMVRRIEELFDQVHEAIDVTFERGIKRIKIVTDHGWLLMPGGLPKTQLNAGLTETSLGSLCSYKGRCYYRFAAICPGVGIPFPIFIAYAPGISFFKANEEYAHGGISLHECLVPTMIIENPNVLHIEAEVKVVKWVNLKCTIQTSDVPDGYSIMISARIQRCQNIHCVIKK